MDVKFVRYTRDVKGELSITANGTYDVTKYASANVNVQSAPVLLWTNASPTSAFGAQSVSVNGAAYDAYLVEFRRAYNEPIDLGYGFVKKNTLMSCCGARSMSVVSGTYQYGWREIQGATDTTVVFGRGYFTRYDTLATNTNNSYGIPTRIWGVKFTL